MTEQIGDQQPQHTIWTMNVPEAGRVYYGLGRSASYEAARRGDIPTIKIGKKLFVPVRAMERKLG